MKQFSLVFALLLMCQFAFAQYESFDLSKYKLPEIKRHQLDFNFNSNGSFQNSTYYFENDSDEKSESENNQFFGGGDLEYSFYRNSDNFQITGNAQYYLNYEKNKTNNYYSSDVEEGNLTSRISASYDFKYFMGEKKWFLTAVPHLDFGGYKRKDNANDIEINSKRFSGDFGIGAGIGRIEQVQDYRHGILLLQELEKRGVSKRQLSEAEVQTFSSLISELKNKRVFDSRKRKQKDLESIHKFLSQKGIVDEVMDMNYFVGLEDIWVFGALQNRENGKQLKLILTPGYTIDKGKNDADNTKLEYVEVISNLNYRICKPLSLKWQTNYDFGIEHQFTDKLTEEIHFLGASKHHSFLYTNGEIGFFPNTRTYLSMAGTLSFSNSSDNTFWDKERYSSRFILSTSAYYYISERLRLQGFVFLNIDRNGIFNDQVANSKYNNIRYNLTLNYAIF